MKIAGWSIIATIFLGILVVIINNLWGPIADCVGYPFHARRRVQNLLDEVRRLREIEGDLDPKPSSKRYKGWVESVQDVGLNAHKIKTGHDGCGRLNYFNKCRFAKEADMELKKATNLVDQGKELLKELKEAQAKPQAVRQHQDRQIQLWGMDSYKHKVRDFIQKSDNNSTHQSGLLGIWGMGGVGKTSLLEFVRDSCAEHAPFYDLVLFVPAGRGATVGTMQKAVAASLGLSLTKPDDDETSQETITRQRETDINNHLQDKSFLLLIDDLWGNHDDLKHVGIPMPLGKVLCRPHGGGSVQEYHRKIVFTTRSYDVCGRMECANNAIRMECLSEDDAWNLFVDKVGKKTIDDNRKLHNLARKVVDECGGLPRALCGVGQVMSAITDHKEWEHTFHLLEKAKFRKIDDLFKSLKLSYDDMENNFKDCFLVCALWPQYVNIPKEKLVRWWTGLGFLDASDDICGYSIINALVRNSMLEEGDTSICSSEKSHVKMQEVTRKMALWVVNDHGDKEKCLPLVLSSCRSALAEEKWKTVQKAWISVRDSSKWSSSVDCPELTMLVNRHDFSFEALSGFQNITFLDLEGTKMDIFPLVICQLKELQYLNLSATRIGALPLDLKDLSNLKYLYIRDNGALQAIPEELISQLAKLRVLDLFCSGTNSNEGPYFSSLIQGFASKEIDLILGITVHSKEDMMKLIGPLKNVVHTQALCMHRFKVMADGYLGLFWLMEKLRELTITNSSDIKTLAVQGQPSFTDGLFPNLEFFELSNLHELEYVTWKNACLTLRVIIIYNCTKLRHVTWVQCLETLEELTIAYCPELEKVIDNAESTVKKKNKTIKNNAESSQAMEVANRDLVKSFGKLKRLYLEELPKLSIISEHNIPFEELSYVFVARCDNLKIIRVGQPLNEIRADNPVIRVRQRKNHNKIKIDCHEGWWEGLENKVTMNLDFDPTFCWGRLEGIVEAGAQLSAECAAANSIQGNSSRASRWMR